MKKFIDYVKKIHLIEYAVYISGYMILCNITTNIKVIEYIGTLIISFVMMNSWQLEKKTGK